VYADSGSTDGSARTAERLGVPVVSLDPQSPFSAGRGRNEGLAQLLRTAPSTEFVLFLDGDCTVHPDFPRLAVSTLLENPKCAVVTGNLAERHPDRSIYNRLCAIEWRSPPGQIKNMSGLGGIMVVRVSAFLQVGGFNLEAIAGEEPDLGIRLARAGWTVIKVDQPMATHDADMLHFGQWWRRAVRSGHAMAHRYAAVGDTGHQVLSVVLWSFLLPLAALMLLIPTHGASLLLLASYAILGWRIHRGFRQRGFSQSDAALATRFIIIGKFAEFEGILRYLANRWRGRFQVIDWR
jgi:cellulose synthase/poly-beta-1,6-N-acetylglucosamine synthase-like glycosyltransferase